MVKILKNIARDCRCRQSSINPAMQQNPDGASEAVNAARTGAATFFTMAEMLPWWEVDLGQLEQVDSVVIYNWDIAGAPHAEAGRARCRFLQLSGSRDGQVWELLHDRRDGQAQVDSFGGIVHGPLHVDLRGSALQWLRLSLPGGGILHLNAVQVFAEADAEADAALLDMFTYAKELNLKTASRICSALKLKRAALLDHARRLGVTLNASAGWFIFNQLREVGCIEEAALFLAREQHLLGLPGQDVAAAPDEAGAGDAAAGVFDRIAALDPDDPHCWISALPALRAASFDWIDRAYRFRSCSEAGDIDRRAPVLYDGPPAAGKRIYFCGGCEFSYAGYFLRLRGYIIMNTFLDNRSSDPVAQFLGQSGEQLARFKPDLIVLSMEQPFKQLLLKTFTLSAYSRAEQLADLRGLLASFEAAIGTARSCSPHSKLIVLSHISYSNRMMHLYEEATFGLMQGDPYTLHELAKAYDLELSLLARKTGALFLDFDELISKFGKSSADGSTHHARADDYLGGHPELAGARMIANTIDGWITALYPERPKIKLMVLDLDNTLWDGVFRDDGIEHITRHVRVAHCYAALHLAEQGILLALCSKNDPGNAQQLKAVLEVQFPELGRKIVAMRVNWMPKSSNIRSIVEDLNISMDSVAFFDDQPFERAEVAHALPLVRVFSDADLLQVGRYAPFLPVSPVSAEGRARAAAYVNDEERRAEQSSYAAADYEAFLVSCQFQLDLRRGGAADAARVAELFQRTNQQNITLQRTSKEFIDSVCDKPEWQLWCCELSDKFGQYGVIGAMMARTGVRTDIVELAFSCRAMGKGLEKAFLQKMAQVCRLHGATELALAYRHSDRNQGMFDLVRDAGFVDAGGSVLVLALSQLPSPMVYDRWIHWPAGEMSGTPTVGCLVALQADAGQLQ
ncbi:HAD-IIIC family phosphatase [Massilia genomosp. 1]|uniref:HAD-IIIC family phosphatase n=1 Tax=Massilia genomosp. 1 TaxID=2609280 RepID=A0ABX0MR78_9BURK|nr:HAD-IIIC family phosphatase [Massilia genomosp. 1]NHZ64916.1 HAD-IIIC family phosphatase [Massilia genomosp. 1]